MSNRLYSSNDVNRPFDGIKVIVVLFGVFTLSCIAYLYGAFAMGFVGMKLWSWFVVPVFGLPVLTWGQAYGLALVIGLFTHQLYIPTNKDERTTPEKTVHLVSGFLIPWTFLLLGWAGKVLFL